MSLPIGTPITTAKLNPKAIFDIALPCFPGLARFAAIEKEMTTKKLEPIPAITLANNKRLKSFKNGVKNVPTKKINRAIISCVFLEYLLSTMARIGVITALEIANAVINCPAEATDISSEREILSRTPEIIYCEVPTRKLIKVNK